jgi:hypothetical protein
MIFGEADVKGPGECVDAPTSLPGRYTSLEVILLVHSICPIASMTDSILEARLKTTFSSLVRYWLVPA